MKLHQLNNKKGAAQSKKRIGRGPGSGTGKTGGRGMNGQKSRAGIALGVYEGGQMPLYMRLPKRGFNKPNRKRYAIVNLAAIEQAIVNGIINPNATIDNAVLLKARLIRRQWDGVRLLGKGELNNKIVIRVAGASDSAIKAVVAKGGNVEIMVKTNHTSDNTRLTST